MTGPELVLYVRHSCEFCAEAEALLQGDGVPYHRVVVEDSSTPGELVLRHPDGRVERIRRKGFFATPALHDRASNEMRVGLSAIEGWLDLDFA